MAIQWNKRKVKTNAQKRQKVADPTPPIKENKGIPEAEVIRNPPRFVAIAETVGPKQPTKSKPLTPGSDQKPHRTLIIDYQKDVCTQYLKTGRCRYGDACKFSHERGSKPNTKGQKTDKKQMEFSVSGCTVCSQENNIVLPPCEHRYCESCFLKLSKNGDPCVACSKVLKSARPI